MPKLEYGSYLRLFPICATYHPRQYILTQSSAEARPNALFVKGRCITVSRPEQRPKLCEFRMGISAVRISFILLQVDSMIHTTSKALQHACARQGMFGSPRCACSDTFTDCAVCEEDYGSGYQYSCSSCFGEDRRATIGEQTNCTKSGERQEFLSNMYSRATMWRSLVFAVFL